LKLKKDIGIYTKQMKKDKFEKQLKIKLLREAKEKIQKIDLNNL